MLCPRGGGAAGRGAIRAGRVSERMDPMSAPQHPFSPPPHPYANGSARPGRGLAITAMALGLLALLTALVGVFYAPPVTAVGAALGLVAVVLGIVALVLRQRRAPSVTGLAGGGAAMLVAAVAGAMAFASLATPFSELAPTAAPPGQDAEDGGSGGEGAPAVAWPANMSTGGLVFTGDGDGGIELLRSDAPHDNALPEPREASELGQGALVRVYLDYRCPFCGEFERENAQTLADAVASGAAAVELTPLTFLDRVSPDAYSSRAAGAMACVADQQPDAAWDAHAALLDPAFQPAESQAGHDDDALLAELDRATGGLGEGVRSCVEERRFTGFATALNDWVFANPVPHAADPSLTVTGTPLVLVDGVPYTGAPGDGAAFRAFLDAQGVQLPAGS